MQPMKINKELFELAQIRGTIDPDIEPIIFIDNKKLILAFVRPSIKVHYAGNGVASRFRIHPNHAGRCNTRVNYDATPEQATAGGH